MSNIFTYLKYTSFFCWIAYALSAYGMQKEDLFEKDTEEVIDASQTFFITPEAIKQNRKVYQRIHRSVCSIDQFTMVEKWGYCLQNLGNHYTAAQSIPYTPFRELSAHYGFLCYDYYFYHPSFIRYYLTHKAYTYFNIVLANLGSFLFDGCCMYRLSDFCHFGLNIRSVMAEKEWPAGKDVKIVSMLPDLDVFTHIKHPNERYHALLSFSHATYKTNETGGVRSADVFSTDDVFSTEHMAPSLKAQSPLTRYYSTLSLLDEAHMQNKIQGIVSHRETRRYWYLYHHYEWDPKVQIYHEYIRHKRVNCSTIKHPSSVLHFIAPNFRNGKDELLNEDNLVSMHQLSNETGLKGDLPFREWFYRVYYRLAHLDFIKNDEKYALGDPGLETLLGKKEIIRQPSACMDDLKNIKEHYIGLDTRCLVWPKTSQEIYLSGEYLLTPFKVYYHKANLRYTTPVSTISYRTIKHKPPYIAQYGHTRYRPWHCDFLPVGCQELALTLNFAMPCVYIEPMGTFTHITNHIYYEQVNYGHGQGVQDHCLSQPIQAKEGVSLLSYGGKLNGCFFNHYHFDHQLVFFKDVSQSMPKLFKGYMPPYMYTLRYYYANQPFEKKMDIETGLSVHFTALYYADGYDLVAQQFYRQNQFATQGRTICDLFVNFGIRNLKMFVKYSFISEDLSSVHYTDQKGKLAKAKSYFVTPFYPGLKKAADIGIHWSFFD